MHSFYTNVGTCQDIARAIDIREVASNRHDSRDKCPQRQSPPGHLLSETLWTFYCLFIGTTID